MQVSTRRFRGRGSGVDDLWSRDRVSGLGLVVRGLWFMVYGLWFMVYGLWFMDKSSGFRI